MQKRGAKALTIVMACLAALWVWGGSGAQALDMEYNVEVIDIHQQIHLSGMDSNGTSVGFKSWSGGFINHADGDGYSHFSVEYSGVVSATNQNSTFPMDISNDGGLIVGFATDEGKNGDLEYAFVYNTTLSTTQIITRTQALTGDTLRTIITGVNDGGQYVGLTALGTEEVTSNTVLSSFLWDGIGFQDIQYPGADMTIAYDINNAGVIAGHFLDSTGWHGFTCDTAQEPDVFSAPINYVNHGASSHTFITGINSNGDLAGYFIDDRPLNGLEHLEGFSTNSTGRFLGLVYNHAADQFACVDGLNTTLFKMTDSGKTMAGWVSIRVLFTPAPVPPAQPEASSVRTGFTFAEIPSPDVIPGGPMPMCLFPREINNNGVVVGGMADPVSTTHGLVPFVWQGSGAPQLLSPAYPLGMATDINDNGVVAGLTVDASLEYGLLPGLEFPLAFSGPLTGTMDIEPLFLLPYVSGAEHFQGFRVLINNQDEMAASFLWLRGVLWKRGTLDNGGPMVGSWFNTSDDMALTDINEYSQVVGTGECWYSVHSSDYHEPRGVFWDKNDAPAYTYGTESILYMPSGLNNSGLICGTAVERPGEEEEWASVDHSWPFVIEPEGSPITLPLLAGYDFAMATDVNDEGEIVGFAYNDYNFNNWRLVMWKRSGGGYTDEPVDLDDTLDSGYNFVPFVFSPSQISAMSPEELDAAMQSTFNTLLLGAFQPKINDNGQIVTLAYKTDGTPVGVVLTPEDGCVEDDTGKLDVIGGAYCLDNGATFEVPVRIQEGPTSLEAFGFEVTFDPAVLEFDSVVSDIDGILPGLIVQCDYWEANLTAPGVVRIGGVAMSNPIASGADGILCYVRFRSLAAQETQVGLQSLIDDLGDPAWTTSHGCLTRADGDINLDGDVTPSDALCSLQKATLVCDTYCGPCPETPCDVDMDCQCTALDTICILYKYLELPSCLDDLP